MRTKKKIVIVGTGGSGRETLFLLRDIQAQQPNSWEFRGFLSDDPSPNAEVQKLGSSWLGGAHDFFEDIEEPSLWSFIVAIGNGAARSRLQRDLVALGANPATLIHPTAVVAPDSVIGNGSVICANSYVSTNVVIGDSVQINVNTVVAHDCVLAEYVTLAQSVSIAGNVHIQAGATVFTNATVIPSVTIGENATIGAGAVVISDVAVGTTVVGSPARQISN